MIDVSQTLCEYYGFVWFSGDILGYNGRCCDDDGLSDYFGNSSSCCSFGSVEVGECLLSPAGCIDYHVDKNEDYLLSVFPDDMCGLGNCTSDGFAVDVDIDYVWDGYCYDGGLNTTCTTGMRSELGGLPPFNSSFAVTVWGTVKSVGALEPLENQTITVTVDSVDYSDDTDGTGYFEILVPYWELDCDTSNGVSAGFTYVGDGRAYTASRTFTAIK